MARKKKNNPYEEYGLSAAGQSSGQRTYKTDNPYEEFGQSYVGEERDPSLVWDWDKPSTRDVAERKVQQEQAPEEEKKQERKRSIWERIGDTFEANSPEDKQKRKEAGKEEIYQHQKALEQEAKTRNTNFNFSKEEVEARRDYYKRQNIDIDKAIDIRSRYADVFRDKKDLEKAKEEGKGVDWKRLVDQAEKDKLFDSNEEARKDLETARELDKQGHKMAGNLYAQALYKTVKDYDLKKLRSIEQDFSDYTASQKPEGEGTLQQINRNFQRGLVEQIVKFPGSARTMAAGGIDVVAPEGSRLDKFGQAQFEAGKKQMEDTDQKIIDQGLGANAKDNKVVANLSSGAGSLASSVLMASVTGGGSGSKEAMTWLAKARSALNPGLAGGVFGTNAAAEQYVGALDSGKADFKAYATGLLGGAAEGYLEKLGLDKYMGASGGTVKKFFTRALTEGFQEASQSFSQAGVKSTYSDVDFSDALMQALEEGAYGGVVGGGGSLALDLAQNMKDKGVPPEVADQTAQKVADRVNKAAEEEGIKQVTQEDLPEDGDTIVKELNGEGELPQDGDSIIKMLNGEQAPEGGQVTPEQPLPEDGDSIVKELNGQPAPEGGAPVPPMTGTLPEDGDQIVKELNGQAPQGGALPQDGDAIVKELQGSEQTDPIIDQYNKSHANPSSEGFANWLNVNKQSLGVDDQTAQELLGKYSGSQTEALPEDGDSIVKELQGQEAGALPEDGDAIVKELNGEQPTGVEPTDAQSDWDNNYASKVEELQGQQTRDDDIKAMPAIKRGEARAKNAEIEKQVSQLEQEWSGKWKKTATGERSDEGVQPRRKGAMKPLGQKEPDHIRKGREQAKKMTEADVRARISKQLKAYADRNDSPEKFTDDIYTQGGTFGDFNGNYTTSGNAVAGDKKSAVKKGEVAVALADGRVFKFKTADIYNDNKQSKPDKPTYEKTYNVNNKDDAEYLSRIFSEEQVKKFQAGDYSHFRGGNKEYFEKIAKANLVNEGKVEDSGKPEYGMTHRPREDGPRSHALTETGDIPKDMYTEWYGSRNTETDKESIAALKAVKGKPDATVTIYRASVGEEFNSGDWVTFSKSYAEQHAESNGSGMKVRSKQVRARDVRWAMDDVNEFGYYPEKTQTGDSFTVLFPKTEKLPQMVKDRMKGEEYTVVKTVSGREVKVKRDDTWSDRRMNGIYKREAVAEAKAKKDTTAMARFKSVNINNITKEVAQELKDYAFGTETQTPDWQTELKASERLTPTELESVTKKSIGWNKTQLKELIKYSKGLKENPVLTVTEATAYDRYGSGGKALFAEYKSADGSQKFRLPIREIGFDELRLEASGIKPGDTISIGDIDQGIGKIPVLRNTRTGVDYHRGRDNRTVQTMGDSEVARTPEELIAKIEQLNKAGQAAGIMRKGQLRSKKAAGLHQGVTRKQWEQGKLGQIKLRDDTLKNPNAYMTVLAHELSHAMEFAVNGSTGKTLSIFGDITPEEKLYVTEELKKIVDNIEGAEVAQSDPSYFYKPTEMLARYVETMLLFPSKLSDLAPITTELFQKAVVRNPQMGELMDAIDGVIDKDFRNKTPSWWRDLRQIYRQHLGKRVGDIAYNAELVRRARQQNWQSEVGKLIKRKFKGVKDDSASLFRAAEAIRQTDADGNLVYGTRDFVKTRDNQEIEDLIMTGWKPVKIVLDKDGNKLALFAKERYSEAQGKALFEALTPQGQQLVRDFVANKEQAKDIFNRDLIKDVFKIEGELEGWVHRGLREKEKGRMTLGGKRAKLREKTAGMKKQRTAQGGHLENFQKQMEKALREAGDAQINNEFIEKQLARISKPIAKGEEPDKGWVEVTADFKKGLRLPGEGGRDKVTYEKEDMFTGTTETVTFLKPEQRLQVPEKLAEHYRNIRQLPQEITLTQKIMTNVSKYWAINVLLHGGTVGTNFIGGGIQYSAKIANDFYVELLSGNATLPQTRRNVAAMLQVLLPKGWSSAPDYVYGGNHSNYAGQFMTKGKAEGIIDKAGDIGLAPFSAVESYWKKAILISEQGNKMPKKQLEKSMIEFSKAEEEMIGYVNEAIDLYAFDYDNVPMWLESWSRKGGLIKPFAKYPYKYAKMVTNLASGAFDKTLTPQQRAAKLLTLGTMVAVSLALMGWRDDEAETPPGTEKTPAGLDPRGRLFMWKENGEELFIRTAKYPFINITSIGRDLIKGDFEEAGNIVTDQLGTVGPVAKSLLIALGYTNKYEQYAAKDALIGQQVASFIPGFRILNDIGRAMDDSPRKPTNFVQGVMGNMPVWGSEETKQKLRGDKRTVKVPVEPETRKKGDTETIEKDLKNNDRDILLSALTGIYITRIKPDDAKQQALRQKRSAAEQRIEALLTDGKVGEAEGVAKEAGLTIPEGTYRYYRKLREKRGL